MTNTFLYRAHIDAPLQRYVIIEASSLKDAYNKAADLCDEGEFVRGVTCDVTEKEAVRFHSQRATFYGDERADA